MQDSPELRQIIAAWFDAAARGDPSWADRHVSALPATRLVGTAPLEFLSGPQASRFLGDEARALGGRIQVTVEHVEAFAEGSVGWGVALPRITLPDGGTVSPRWSAVFHLESGHWKLVQLHASIAVSNEASFGNALVPATATDR